MSATLAAKTKKSANLLTKHPAPPEKIQFRDIFFGRRNEKIRPKATKQTNGARKNIARRKEKCLITPKFALETSKNSRQHPKNFELGSENWRQRVDIFARTGRNWGRMAEKISRRRRKMAAADGNFCSDGEKYGRQTDVRNYPPLFWRVYLALCAIPTGGRTNRASLHFPLIISVLGVGLVQCNKAGKPM